MQKLNSAQTCYNFKAPHYSPPSAPRILSFRISNGHLQPDSRLLLFFVRQTINGKLFILSSPYAVLEHSVQKKKKIQTIRTPDRFFSFSFSSSSFFFIFNGKIHYRNDNRRQPRATNAQREQRRNIHSTDTQRAAAGIVAPSWEGLAESRRLPGRLSPPTGPGPRSGLSAGPPSIPRSGASGAT